MIQLQHLSKSFQHDSNKTDVLHDINLTISEGTWLSIVGPSGSGKTTLLHCMTGLLQPDSGSVVYNDTDIYRLDDNKRSDFRLSHIGFVFQDFKLLPHYSVLDNVIMPLLYHRSKKELHTKAKAHLKQVGIEETLFTRLPGGLSGGEKQRVSIARALIADPDVLISDEPTGNLDRSNRDQLTGLLQHLNHQGKTIVTVTHDMTVAHYGNKIFHLLDGSLSPDEEVRK